MRTFPRLEPLTINNFVGKEIKRRLEMFGSKAIPRSVWIRAISNNVAVSTVTTIPAPTKEDTEDIMGDKNILVGGLLTKDNKTRAGFETIYNRPGQQIQDRPIPGIESIQITSKGDLQSLRELTINWYCPSVEDLDRLAPYWLSPGVSIWVEWGWSEYGRSIVSSNINEKMIEYWGYGQKIYKDIIELSQGNQDAYIGVIKNFSWNQEDDGGFKCTTTLSSMGQTFLSLDLNKDKIKQGGEGEKKSDEKSSAHRIKEFIRENFTEEKLKGLSRPNKGKKYIDTGDIFIIGKDKFLGLWGGKKVFVSWRFIEDAIVNAHAILKKGNIKSYELNSSGVKISNDALLYTTDIDSLLIIKPTGRYWKKAIYFTKDPDGINENDSDKEGFVRSLYINSDFVRNTFDNAETLNEALSTILQGMSKSAGDIWRFQIQPKPDNENILEVVDLNFTSINDLNHINMETENKQILSLGGYSGKSVLISLSFQSKMTDQLALNYFAGKNMKNKNIAINNDNNAGMYMFRQYKDRILGDLLESPAPQQTENSDKKSADDEISKSDEFNISVEEMRKSLSKGSKSKYIKIPEGGIIVLDKKGKDILVEYLNRPPENDKDSQRVRFTPIYPLEVSVTIDGLSGVVPGHCFVLDNIPSLYKNAGVFQVVEVGHDVNDSEWTTNLRCYFRVIKAI